MSRNLVVVSMMHWRRSLPCQPSLSLMVMEKTKNSSCPEVPALFRSLFTSTTPPFQHSFRIITSVSMSRVTSRTCMFLDIRDILRTSKSTAVTLVHSISPHATVRCMFCRPFLILERGVTTTTLTMEITRPHGKIGRSGSLGGLWRTEVCNKRGKV